MILICSSRIFAALLLSEVAIAWSNSSSSPSTSLTFPTPSGYSTTRYNVSATTTTLTYEYTNEELAILWDQIGLIPIGPITTTVSPTPEPSYYLRPGSFHPQATIHSFGNGPVNEQGVAHYDDLISSMVAAGIKPVVTLFHWDTPLALVNSYGAWTNPRIVDDFFNYVTFVISRYDKYVPIWYTFNEPQYCNWQYEYYPAGNSKGYYPTYHGITGGLPARIACSHYTILAHSKVAKWYHEIFKGKGRISFKNSANYFEPNNTESAGDIDFVNRNYAFVLGWFGGPWTDGDYPAIVKGTLGSLLDNYTSKEEKDMIQGSCDFYAIDAYTGYLATVLPNGSTGCAANKSDPNFPECAGSTQLAADSFPLGPAADNGVSWLYSTPVAIRRFLKVITKDLFPSIPDIVVSEFGFAEPFEGDQTSLSTILWALRRADYYQGFLDNILAAKIQDGVNVTGAFGWAIFDNFEWFSGSRVKFGLQYLNQMSLERYPKASMFQFLDWFKLHGGATLGTGAAGGNASAIPDTG